MKSSKPEITEEMIQEEMARQAHGGVLVGNLLTSVIVGIAWWLITL